MCPHFVVLRYSCPCGVPLSNLVFSFLMALYLLCGARFCGVCFVSQFWSSCLPDDYVPNEE